MNRPFLRVYATLAVVIVVVTIVLQWSARRHFDRQLDERVAEVLQAPLERLRAEVAAMPPGRAAPERLERMVSERLGFPAHVVRRPPPELADQLRSDEIQVVEHRGRRAIWARLSDDAWIHIGPPPREGPRRRPRARVLGPLLVLILAGAGTLAMLRPMERRLQRLGETARGFGQGDLSRRANDDTEDAIGRLAGEFDRMADRVADTLRGQRDLLRAVSHELRTPLARMTLALDEALDIDDERQRVDMLRRMERSLEDMRGLVDELMAMGRLESAGVGELAPVDVDALLADAKHLASDLDAELVVEIEASEGRVHADRRLLRRALHNLVTNAVRYAASRVRLGFRSDGDDVEFSVEDDGPGIPEADRERLFEAFARGDDSRDARLGGVGLGLAIVRQVAQAHGGRVWVESSTLGGARLVIRIPAGDDAG